MPILNNDASSGGWCSGRAISAHFLERELRDGWGGQDVLNPVPSSLPHRPAPGHRPYHFLLQTRWLQRLLGDEDPKVTHSCHQVLSGQQGLQAHSPRAQGPPNGWVAAEFTQLLLLLPLLLLLLLLVPGHRTLQSTHMG